MRQQETDRQTGETDRQARQTDRQADRHKDDKGGAGVSGSENKRDKPQQHCVCAGGGQQDDTFRRIHPSSTTSPVPCIAKVPSPRSVLDANRIWMLNWKWSFLVPLCAVDIGCFIHTLIISKNLVTGCTTQETLNASIYT